MHTDGGAYGHVAIIIITVSMMKNIVRAISVTVQCMLLVEWRAECASSPGDNSSGERMVSPLPYSGPQDGLFPVLALQGQRWPHPPSSGHGVVLLAGVSGCVQSDQCTFWDNHHMVHSTQHLPALPWIPSPWGKSMC